MEEDDRTKFINLEASKRFTLISTQRSFIKEKELHHPEDFFKKTKLNKGWKALCQPPRLTATMVVHRVLRQPSSLCGEEVKDKRGYVKI